MSAGRFDRRTAIVGGGPSAEALVRALDAEEHRDVQIVGIFDDRDEDRSPDMVGGYPKLGTTDDLIEFVRRTHLDLVIFTLPITAEDRILQMLRKLWVLPVDIRLAAHQSQAAAAAAQLLLHRLRAGAAGLRPAHRRLGRWSTSGCSTRSSAASCWSCSRR